MKITRARGDVAFAVTLLVLAIVLGICAFAVAGGLWLLILAVGCLVGVAALELAAAREPEQIDERPDQPLVIISALALLVVAAFALILPIAVAVAGHGSLSGTLAGPAPSSTAAPNTGAPTGSPSAGPGSTGATRPNIGTGPTSYVTAGSDVQLRAAATTASVALTAMIPFATPVTVSCYQAGETVHGEPYWFRASYAGVLGYVSALWLDAGADPLRTGLPHC